MTMLKHAIKRLFALHVSLAYLGMLTGFGAIIFTCFFFYLIFNGSEMQILNGCEVCRWFFIYLTFVIGPGALSLATWFYVRATRMQRMV